jgi:hypothetical protein
MNQTASVFVLALLGCGTADQSVDLRRSEEGYSLQEPDGWTPTRVRNSMQFTAPNTPQTRRHAIVVRTAPIPKESSTAELVVATERVLRALPAARMDEPRIWSNGTLPGTRFSVTFKPSGQHATYVREHAVLFGRRMFHVIYTAPAGEKIDEAAFLKILNSLNEEG